MPSRELKATYGNNGGTAGAIQRAIRAEIAGGAPVLDLLELMHQIVTRQPPAPADTRALAQAVHNRLNQTADEMAAEIRRRYGMPPGGNP
jgi:hypothetical protein